MADKTIKHLKALWEQEKEEYKTAEIGTGVQKFVKHIFESKELFNLEEGKLSTDDSKRCYEFLSEAKKKRRRADIVIFIDSEVVIPVEVKKYTFIKEGIKQIYNYQSDWTKKYGILTDGNEWWFYNNRIIEKKFVLKEILEKPEIFLTYWREYINPEYYYRSFFEKKGQLELFEIPAPNLDDVREDFFLVITNLIENFKNKLNLKGYFVHEINEIEKDKRSVEITYAYFIQFILYKVLVDNSFSDFEEDWSERLKSIDRSIRSETYGDVLTKIKGISDKISDKIYKRFNDEQLMINDKLREILSAPKTVISDVSVWLDILLFINRYNFANVQNEIFGYVYENYLKDLYLDEKKGQYFTDPNVVEFMLNEVGYTKEDLRKRLENDNDSISIIDPSCGSGTFLYNATYRIVEAFFDGSFASAKNTEILVNDNIFGFDIAEFPLYLAEMNILMRMLPIIINENYNNTVEKKIKVFKTRDSISEFLDTGIRNTLHDIDLAMKKSYGQMSMFQDLIDLGYDSFMRNKGDLNELKESLEVKNRIPRLRFDFVVGNPPYVSYNECASQNILFFNLMKEGMVKLNDVYGINLHSVEDNRKKYPPKPNLYSFFMALGFGLLKDSGKICYILPQTLITESDYDVLRWYLARYTTIEKIILFENPMFMGRGIRQNNTIATSSLIIIFSKSIPTNSHKVKIYHHDKQEVNIQKTLENIKDKRKSKHFSLKQNVLLKNYLNWIILKLDDKTIELYDEYRNNNETIKYYSEHNLATERFKSNFYFDVGFIFDKSKIQNNALNSDDFEIINLKNFKGFTNYLPKEYYPNNLNLIKLPKNSQGYSTLSKKYKIVWGKVYSNQFYFTDRNVLPSMSYTQFISSDNKLELLYLFSLLNSKTNNFIYHQLFHLGNEKYGIFIVVKRIKEFIKIPIISGLNQFIKTEIINCTLNLIQLEKDNLNSIIEFKTNLLQKYDSLEVIDNNLIIHYKGNVSKCRIKNNIELVEKIISDIGKMDLLNKDGIGLISELKAIPVFDKDYQGRLKDYIDDLVFALYFRIELTDIEFEKAKEINLQCAKHKFYELVNSN